MTAGLRAHDTGPSPRVGGASPGVVRVTEPRAHPARRGGPGRGRGPPPPPTYLYLLPPPSLRPVTLIPSIGFSHQSWTVYTTPTVGVSLEGLLSTSKCILPTSWVRRGSKVEPVPAEMVR